MRELNYENQGTNTYLVYEIRDTDVVDSMSLGMLTNNRISGLAQTIFTQMDNSKYIKFNVSAKVSVAQFFMGSVNKKRLLGVFKGIADAILASEDYMLDVNNMLLDLDYIFTDVSSCETILLCLPVAGEDNSVCDMKNFFRNIMFSTQFDQTENCDYVARLINYLNSTPTFSMADFRELVVSLLNGESGQVVEKQPTPQAPQVTVQQAQAQPEVVQKVAPQVQEQKPIVSQPQAAPQKPVVEQPKVEIPTPQYSVRMSSLPEGGEKKAEPVAPVAAEPEQQMTMIGLLRNFSKENMALYKAQKEAQKAAPKPEKTKDKKEKAKAVAPTANPGFAIPGQAPAAAAPVNVPPKQAAVTPQQPKVEPVTSTPQSVASTPITTGYTGSTAPQTRPMNFGETTVLGGGNFGETTVLNAMPQQTVQPIQPVLIRAKNNEKINLNKPIFRIGKERSFVDYFIGDNTAISRCHANVIEREGEYYVVDTNSTNHTFVNGKMINSNEEVKISDGDKIRLANEDFEFQLR